VAFNKEKITANAMKFLQKGALEKAVREYEKILEVEPNDERTLQKIGDLYTRMNRKQEALNAYNRVSKLYTKQGFFLKAIAVFKQILTIDPDQIELYGRLAEMYHQLGLLTETIQQYETLTKHYERTGKHDKVLDILKKMTRIDPDNLPNRIRYAEGIIKNGQKDEGLDEYESIIDELKREDREDEYVRILERYTSHAPDRLKRNLELSRVYLDRGETRKGLSRLKSVLKLDSENLETLALLSRAFKGLNQLAKTITVLHEMARIYKINQDENNLKQVLEQILKIDPENSEAKKEMESIRFESIPSGNSTASVLSGAESQLDELQSLSEIGETVDPANASKTSVTQVKPANAELDPAAVTKIMTEAEVFIKYGLHDQALERLLTVNKALPDNIEALQYLGETCAALDENENAEEFLLFAAILHLENGNRVEAQKNIEEAWTLEVNTERVENYLADFDSIEPQDLATRIRTDYSGGPDSSSQIHLTASTLPTPLSQSQANLSDGEKELLMGSPKSDQEIDDLDEIEFTEDNIDFDQEIQLVDDVEADEIEEVEEEELDVDELILDTPEIEFDSDEPEIVEEIKIPEHMIKDEAEQTKASGQPTPPSIPQKAKPKAKPPKLPTMDGIEVQDEFDGQSVEELLIEDALLESPEPLEATNHANKQNNLDISADDADVELEVSDIIYSDDPIEELDEIDEDLEEEDFGEILDLDDIEDNEDLEPEAVAEEISKQIEDADSTEAESTIATVEETGDLRVEPETSQTFDERTMELETLEFLDPEEELREDEDSSPKQGEEIPTVDMESISSAEQVVTAKLTGIDPAIFEEQETLHRDEEAEAEILEDDIEVEAEAEIIEDDIEVEAEAEIVEDDIEVEAEAEIVEDDIEVEAEADIVEDGIEVEAEAEIIEDDIEVEAEAEILEDDIEVEAEAEIIEDDIEVEAEAEILEDDIEVEAEAEILEDDIEVEAEAEILEDYIEVEAEAEIAEDDIEVEAEAEIVEDDIEVEAEAEIIEDDIEVEAEAEIVTAPAERVVEDFVLVDEFIEAEDKKEPELSDISRLEIGNETILSEELENILSEEEMEDYEEAQFFFQQGIYNECIETYEELLESHPANPILGKLADECKVQIALEEEKLLKEKAQTEIPKTEHFAPEATVVKSQTAEPQDGTVNLSDEIFSGFDLEDEEEPEAPALQETTNKRSLNVSDIEDDDTETHYNLGIAYKEMGLINEAIGEFLVAIKNGYSIKTAVILALCYLEKNNTEKALEFLSNAVNNSKLTKLRLLEIRYDIAMFYLSKSKNDIALLHFVSIENINPSFHDVQQKVEDLSKTSSAAEADNIFKLLESVNIDNLPDDLSNGNNVSFL